MAVDVDLAALNSYMFVQHVHMCPGTSLNSYCSLNPSDLLMDPHPRQAELLDQVPQDDASALLELASSGGAEARVADTKSAIFVIDDKGVTS